MCYSDVSWGFSSYLFTLISSLIPARSESRHCMISILLQPLKYVLWPKRCSILVNVPRELEKNVYSIALGQSSP